MNKLKRIKTVLKPWGKEIWFAQVTGKYMGKVLIIHKGKSTSLHYHKKKEETLIVISGHLTYTCIKDEKGKRYRCRMGFHEIIHIPPGMHHSLAADHQTVTLLEVSTCHPEDSFRVEDYHKRACNG